MISFEDYFGPWIDHKDATAERKANAAALLKKVNALLAEAAADGVPLEANPVTSNAMHHRDEVSGGTYGGFRPQSCPLGAPESSHKIGRGVDVFDPKDDLDNWITDAKLEAFGLYREAPVSTHTWCHLSDRAPHSGRRTFLP